MSFILELPSSMEEQLRREAALKGVAADDLARDIIARYQRRVPRWAMLTSEEEEQINAMNSQLTPDYWRRFNALQSQHHSLSAVEREEFLQLWLQAEEWNVHRLELLEAIAQKRGKRFSQLMKALRIAHHPSARPHAAGA